MKSSFEIVHDGRIITQNRDPPGQTSIYIAPGDTRKETYRLSTYRDFPQNVQINVCLFAACGFYYTGYNDRVKCFSCGQACDTWVVGDDIKSPVWHKSDCDFVNGRDTSNVPISEFTARFSRVQSSSGHPTSRAAQQNITAPQSSSRSSASFQPPRSTPPPSVAAASRVAEAPLSSPVSLPENTTSSRPVDPLQLSLYPCRDPINPHMRNVEARLQTFIDHSNTWPSDRIRATPEEIADAGMFCLGVRDRAKCWYCNGGLQNWDWEDDPWLEHAKWFPLCEYVLQRKGFDYVFAIVSQFPSLDRPTLYNPATADPTRRLLEIMQQAPSVQRPPPEPAPEIIDPREELRKRNEKVDEYMRSSEVVSQAVMMGFEEVSVKEAVKGNFQLHDQGFTNLRDLVDAIQALETPEGGAGDIEMQSQTAENIAGPPESSSLDEVQRLQDSRLCKVCRKEQSCMVFIPCGHLAACENCGKDIKKCPLCNELIRQRVRSYLS